MGVALGERGGETFFSNPYLSATILAAGACGIAAGVVGGLALVRGDRSPAVFLGVAVGVVVIFWVTAEAIGHEEP